MVNLGRCRLISRFRSQGVAPGVSLGRNMGSQRPCCELGLVAQAALFFTVAEKHIQEEQALVLRSQVFVFIFYWSVAQCHDALCGRSMAQL